MKTMQLRSHVGSNGVLELKLDSGVTETDVDVVVIVNAAERGTAISEPQRDEWQKFVHDTAGSISDPSFYRHGQGELQTRDSLS
jgi:hypothetical protein